MICHPLRDTLKCHKAMCCVYCGKPCIGNGTIEHLIPKSRGGTNHEMNKRRCCRQCNNEKDDMLPIEYLQWFLSFEQTLNEIDFKIKVVNIISVHDHVKVNYSLFKSMSHCLKAAAIIYDIGIDTNHYKAFKQDIHKFFMTTKIEKDEVTTR